MSAAVSVVIPPTLKPPTLTANGLEECIIDLIISAVLRRKCECKSVMVMLGSRLGIKDQYSAVGKMAKTSSV